jgi:hypothetical protein
MQLKVVTHGIQYTFLNRNRTTMKKQHVYLQQCECSFLFAKQAIQNC